MGAGFPEVKADMRAIGALLLIVLLAPFLLGLAEAPVGEKPAAQEPPAAKVKPSPVSVVDFTTEKDVAAGDDFHAWMLKQGWESLVGNPAYFSIQKGSLDMISRAGPVFRKRAWHAIFNRDKLRHGIENQVLMRMTGEDFKVDPAQYPIIAFKMAPVRLPGKGADMLDPDKNDTAFNLLVSFDGERHPYMGAEFPESIGYVWPDKKFDKEVGSDPDYAPFMRYIPIGYGDADLDKPREVRRNVRDDWRLAFPERKDKPVPQVIRVAVMIDSNSVDSECESRLYWVRFEAEEKKAAPAPAKEPKQPPAKQPEQPAAK